MRQLCGLRFQKPHRNVRSNAMGTLGMWGSFCFVFVIGWVTYRTLRRSKSAGLSDLATVIGAIGGAAITGLFPKESAVFATYGIGLAVGFFLYFIVSLIISAKAGNLSAVNEWLGEPPHANHGGVALEDIHK
jgi:hypothetical protein